MNILPLTPAKICQDRISPNQPTGRCSSGGCGKWLLSAACAFLITLGPAIAHAQTPAEEASQILKNMSDYMASQKTIDLTFDSDIEVITPDLQKIQFDSSGSVLLERPDKLLAKRDGGYAKVEMIFNGKTLTYYSPSINSYAQVDMPGSLDQMIDRLRNEFGIAAPGADLLGSNPFHTLMAGVMNAKYIGPAVIDGIQCEHLAFRNFDTDWQIWVQAGPNPIPRKYVITSKTLTAAPQYTVRIRDWETSVKIGPDAFAVKLPQDAKKVAPQAMSRVDEVPPGAVTGGNQ